MGPSEHFLCSMWLGTGVPWWSWVWESSEACLWVLCQMWSCARCGAGLLEHCLPVTSAPCAVPWPCPCCVPAAGLSSHARVTKTPPTQMCKHGPGLTVLMQEGGTADCLAGTELCLTRKIEQENLSFSSDLLFWEKRDDVLPTMASLALSFLKGWLSECA